MLPSTEKKILECAQYIIENNASIPQTAEALGCSVRSVQKYINEDDKLKKISKEIYLTVRRIVDQKEKEGKIKGGKKGKRGPSIDEKTILKIAKDIIGNNLTYEMASAKYNIPTSTIFENVRKIKNNNIQIELDKIASLNRGK